MINPPSDAFQLIPDTPYIPRRPTETDRLIGASIRKIRRRRRITQLILAQRIGVSFPQVQKYEAGTNRISVTALIKIAEALDVRPVDLIAHLCADMAAASKVTSLTPDTRVPRP